MTDEEVGAIWRDECAKADHITWAATAFARRIEAVERERCAAICEEARDAVWPYHAPEVLNAACTVCENLAKRIRGVEA